MKKLVCVAVCRVARACVGWPARPPFGPQPRLLRKSVTQILNHAPSFDAQAVDTGDTGGHNGRGAQDGTKGYDSCVASRRLSFCEAIEAIESHSSWQRYIYIYIYIYVVKIVVKTVVVRKVRSQGDCCCMGALP